MIITEEPVKIELVDNTSVTVKYNDQIVEITVPSNNQFSTLQVSTVPQSQFNPATRFSSEVLDIVAFDAFGNRVSSFAEPVVLCFSSRGTIEKGKDCLSFYNTIEKRWECEDSCLDVDDSTGLVWLVIFDHFHWDLFRFFLSFQ